MNTNRVTIIIIALLVTAASLACVTSPTSTPVATSTPAHTSTPAPTFPPTAVPADASSGCYDGVWKAEAATGDVIKIVVENDMVVLIEIAVTVYGEGWNAYSERVHPVSAPIVGGTLFVEVRSEDWVTQVVGSFEDGVLKGSLNAAHLHPQGMGVAEAMGVNFTATRYEGGGL
jgi:hypothetical protein